MGVQVTEIPRNDTRNSIGNLAPLHFENEGRYLLLFALYRYESAGMELDVMSGMGCSDFALMSLIGTPKLPILRWSGRDRIQDIITGPPGKHQARGGVWYANDRWFRAPVRTAGSHAEGRGLAFSSGWVPGSRTAQVRD